MVSVWLMMHVLLAKPNGAVFRLFSALLRSSDSGSAAWGGRELHNHSFQHITVGPHDDVDGYLRRRSLRYVDAKFIPVRSGLLVHENG